MVTLPFFFKRLGIKRTLMFGMLALGWAHPSIMLYYIPGAHVSWAIAISLKPPQYTPSIMGQIH